MKSRDRAVAWLAGLVAEDGEPAQARRANWFLGRQAPDGTWAPSTFLSPEPSIAERMTKTAEHAMEIDAVVAALAGKAAVTK